MSTVEPSRRRILGWPESWPARGVVAVIGANGSGKSTLLHSLAGLIPAIGVTPVPEPIGLLLQDAEVGWLASTVEEEVTFGVPDVVDLKPLLSSLGLEGLGARDPRELSAGEQHRVQLAAILIRRPRSLLVDEPAAHLDPQSADAVWRLIRDGNFGGDLIVHASTELEDAVDADAVVVVAGSEIVAILSPDEVAASDVSRWGLLPTDAMCAAAEWGISPSLTFDRWPAP